MPRVSVLMPAHDTARYIGAAIDSIRRQTLEDFEFVILDDGSTDDTAAIAAAHAAADPRIRLQRGPNIGITPTLNAGLALCRGAYIARMDADDIARPDRLERQAAFLDAHPDHVMVGGQMRLIDPDDRPIRVFPLPTDHDALDRRLLVAQIATPHPAAMLRADAVRAVGGYRTEFPAAQDIDLFLRLAETGRIANLPDVVLDYRLHARSVGHARRLEQLRLAWRAARDAHARRGLPFTLPEPSVSDVGTPAQTMARWAWWALRDGHVATARRYALRTLWAAPFERSHWRLAACALRGH